MKPRPTPSLSDSNYTTAPVEAAPASALEPEFCRIADLQRLFGIRRGMAYLLIAEGKIRSVSLRRKGAIKGLRLIHIQSVRDFLYQLEKEANGSRDVG